MINQIICNEIQNLDVQLQPNSVSLSIIVLPSNRLDLRTNVRKFFRNTLKEIAKVTKTGGICCIVTGSDIPNNSKSIDFSEMQALLEIQNALEIKQNWVFNDKILWSKSSKDSVKSLNPTNEITMISFDQTPFSTIHVLVKNHPNEDFEDISISDRIHNLKISRAKKEEMLDSFWYVVPKSENRYKDHLPKELIARLIMIFSNENELILDPFAGHCLTGLICKSLKRNFICLIQNQDDLDMIKKRINKEGIDNGFK